MTNNRNNNDEHYQAEDFDLADTVVLVDDEDVEHTFTVLEYLEVEGQIYAVLLPRENPDDGAYIFRVETDADGEDVLFDIEDDEEFERVIAVLEDDDFA